MPEAAIRAAATLRHDLRTLLNAILGYTELWLEEGPGGAEAEALEAIHAGGQHLLSRVNELLDPGRIAKAAGASGLSADLAELRQPIGELVSQTEKLLVSTAEPSLAADLRKIEAAGEKLLAMIASGAGAEDAAAVSIAALPARAVSAAGSRVLVVDDNEVNRDVLSRRLAREGHTVALAEDGAHALALLERENYDLVLLDIMMPGLNGYQVLERIRADTRWSELPVVMISSVDDLESVAQCIEMGAEDYLPKPFNAVLLRARVNACLEKKRLREARFALQRAEEERLRRELEMAARVQRRLLPERAPEIAGLDLGGGCLPARGVGGDYFDFLELDSTHLGLAIADVAGKGMPAALVMAAFVACLRSQAHQYTGRLAELACRLNLQMHSWTDTSKFVTLFFGCLDQGTGRLSYVNAGHNPPLVVRAGGCVVQLPDIGGPPLGLLPGASYAEGSIGLEGGDVLVAYTDGVTEAFNPREEEFGEERLVQAVLRSTASSASEIWQSVAAAVQAWSSGAEQSDDLTLMVAKLTG